MLLQRGTEQLRSSTDEGGKTQEGEVSVLGEKGRCSTTEEGEKDKRRLGRRGGGKSQPLLHPEVEELLVVKDRRLALRADPVRPGVTALESRQLGVGDGGRRHVLLEEVKGGRGEGEAGEVEFGDVTLQSGEKAGTSAHTLERRK